MMLRVHRIIWKTKVEGPGVRTCIQVQGCPIRCRGCAVPFTWDEDGGVEMDIGEIAERILQDPEIEGVTYMGGEPFAQAQALAELGKMLRRHGRSVVTFTGYTLEQLQAAGNPGYLELVAVTDLLIDGPFQIERLDTSRPWIGSSNQRYHFLTDRYKDLKDQLDGIPNRLEVRLLPDGRVFVNGLAEKKLLDELFEGLLRDEPSDCLSG